MFIDIQICDIELYTSWSEGDGGKDTYIVMPPSYVEVMLLIT